MENLCQTQSRNQKWSAKWMSGTEDWTLLFHKQSDYDTGLAWGDAGNASFWIRKQDLPNRNFDKVWMVTESA